MRVLVDVPAVDRELDYAAPTGAGFVEIGDIVRVPLPGRSVRGWVVDPDSVPPAGVTVKEVKSVVGRGPAPDLVDLAAWAAWRWSGRRVRFLRTASPSVVVRRAPATGAPDPTRDGQEATSPSATPRRPPAGAGGFSARVVRVPPAGDAVAAVSGHVAGWVAGGGSALVLAPSTTAVSEAAGRLTRDGLAVAVMPRGWAAASEGGQVVIGSRAAAWAPAPRLRGVVVLDAHDEAYREESAPTWDAVAVAEERARRAGCPFLALSPCPTVALLAGRVLETVPRAEERRGWAALTVVDMSSEDPHRGLYSDALVRVLRTAEALPGRRVLCVLNRKGRARLVACARCGRLQRCGHCGAALGEADSEMECRVCSRRRPAVCDACGALTLRRLRPGVTRVAHELAALTGVAVTEVSGPRVRQVEPAPEAPAGAVVVGTEALLHRVSRARAVAFLDFDQELTAPRLSAPEHALALLARASAVVGGRAQGSAVLVQTRVPDHEVLQAAVHADPSIAAGAESTRRRALDLPPYSAVAMVSGAGAAELIALVHAPLKSVEFGSDRWLVRGSTVAQLCDGLAAARSHAGEKVRSRVEIDPARL